MNSIAARACWTTISDKKHPEIVAGQARPAMNIAGQVERRENRQRPAATKPRRGHRLRCHPRYLLDIS